LRKNNQWQWEKDKADSFHSLPTILTEKQVLQYPDFTKPFVLTTDASGFAVGDIEPRGNWTRQANFFCEQNFK
jgi:hypothetical protein